MRAVTDDDLALALELADLADEITLARYLASDLKIETKPDMTPVTEADRAVEEALRARIAGVHPGDAVIGEEFGGSEDRGGRTWIIDPIDGTKSYLRGMPTWSTLIALSVAGELTVGVASMPALSRRWWALRGAGALADGQPIHVSSVSGLSDAQLAWGGIEDWDSVGRTEALLALGRACWRTRGVGDAWQYMLVAEGSAEIALDPAVSVWDLAAVKVIVEEAGGRFTDFGGVARADGGSGLATNGLVHEDALAILGGSASGDPST
jgi:histidinol-phosphatase